MGEGQRRNSPAGRHAGALIAPRHDRQRIGRDAEATAGQHLEAHAHRILLRNYRCRMGEIDLVARDESRPPPCALVIAEVRLRTRRDFGGGAASVDHRKQLRLLRAARHLLLMHPELARMPVRFDVLDLSPADEGYHIEWIRHAFTG